MVSRHKIPIETHNPQKMPNGIHTLSLQKNLLHEVRKRGNNKTKE